MSKYLFFSFSQLNLVICQLKMLWTCCWIWATLVNLLEILYRFIQNSSLRAAETLIWYLSLWLVEWTYLSLQVAVLKSEGKSVEKGPLRAVTVAPCQAQKIMTVHVTENGETVVQEAYEATTTETGEIAHFAIETYEDGGEFSVVEQPDEESRGPEYR